MSNTFKPGDRIVYVGKYQYYHNPSNLGRAGTQSETGSES